MSKQQEMHYKETTPMDTVKKLQDILKGMNIEISEDWQPASSIGTYALRATFKGTDVGTNGKGVSKEYSLASAYAEFFERYQNNMISYAVDGYEVGMPFHVSSDEKILSSSEIMENPGSFINFYNQSRNLGNASKEEQAKNFREIHRGEFIVYGKEDQYVCLPFYSLANKRVEYLPQSVYRVFYGSNGMCAGNSPEEAIVQGISEIIERAVQKKLFLEKPTLPDIPEDYIKKFPYIYEMFSKLKENKGFKYFLKDCSFGGKYPVAALIVVEENTGRYGIKLGCHPDFGVAMERTFTEAAQGQDILGYSNRSVIDFQNNGVEEELNIYNSYKVGLGQFPYQLFGPVPSWKFTPVKDVSKMTNHEIFVEWINEIKADGYDILIRDASVLGFPAYHIIIPGLSEMNCISNKHFRAYNTRHLVSGLLLNPEKVNSENCKYIRACLEYYLNSLLENSISSFRQRADNSNVPGEKYGAGCLYMISICDYIEGRYLEAAKAMRSVMNRAVKNSIGKDEINEVTAMYNYLSARATLNSHEEVMEYLKVFFDETSCAKLNDFFSDPSKIFCKIYSLEKNDGDDFSKAHKYYCECMKKLLEVEVDKTINQTSIEKLVS